MKRLKEPLLLLCLIIFSLKSVSAFECATNEDCNHPHGKCESNNECLCEKFYSDKDCSDHWDTNHGWKVLFWIYATVVLVAHIIFISIITQQLYVTFRYYMEGKWTRWNVISFALMSGWVGCFLRILLYAVDPVGIRGIFGIGAEIIYNISLVLYFQAGFMVYLYWVELQEDRGLKHMAFVTKYRGIFIIFIVVATIVELGVTIWGGTSANQMSSTIQNGFYAILFITMIIISSYGGYALIRTMRQAAHLRAGASGYDQFVKKLLTYILVSDLVWFVAVITLMIYVVGEGPLNKWVFILCQIGFRTEEAFTIGLFLWFVKKSPPRGEPVQSASSVRTLNLTISPSKESGSASGSLELEDAPVTA